MEFGVTPRGYRFVAVSLAFFFLDNTRRLPHHNLFRFVSQNTMMLSAAVSRPHVRPAAPCARARSSTTPVACARILSVSYCGLSTRSGASEGALVDLGLGRMERRGSAEAVSRRSSVSVVARVCAWLVSYRFGATFVACIRVAVRKASGSATSYSTKS